MTEALQLWKNIAGKGDGSPDDSKPISGGRHIWIVCHNLFVNHPVLVHLSGDCFLCFRR